MTSQINYASINENFPVAGQDNDTQVFRDNFDTIKTSLRTAQQEITNLQNSTEGLNLDEVDGGSDFNNGVIYNAVLQYCLERRNPPTPVSLSVCPVDFQNGPYQIFQFSINSSISFLQFPTNTNPALTPGVGKIMLELYGDGTPRTVTFQTEGGTVFKKNTSAAWGGTSLNPTLTITDGENPVFVEVWQHNSNKIFLNYKGQFS